MIKEGLRSKMMAAIQISATKRIIHLLSNTAERKSIKYLINRTSPIQHEAKGQRGRETTMAKNKRSLILCPFVLKKRFFGNSRDYTSTIPKEPKKSLVNC
jgi:hypothetical protein